jgi:hypothetical protein
LGTQGVPQTFGTLLAPQVWPLGQTLPQSSMLPQPSPAIPQLSPWAAQSPL